MGQVELVILMVALLAIALSGYVIYTTIQPPLSTVQKGVKHLKLSLRHQTIA